MSDEPIVIEVAKREDARREFVIGEETYHFKIPKLYGLMDTIQKIQSDNKGAGANDVAVFGKVEAWLFDALDKKESDRLRARLLDPKDDLDIEHLVAVFQELTKIASNRPSG